MQSTRWVHEILWISTVKVIHWPSFKVTQIQTFSNFVSLKTLCRLKPIFMEPPWGRGIKMSTNGLCHMTKMAAMSIYGTNLYKNILLLNQKADDLETLYAALVTQLLLNLFKWWPFVDLGVFYSKVKFGLFCFCMGKCLRSRFPRNYWSIWGEYRCTYSQINEYMII